jgi:hypothetical protein
MFAALLFTLVHAQTSYSPALYSEQTKDCRFPKSAPSYNDTEWLELDVVAMRRLYPLSSPLISQPAFLQKLSEALYKNEADCKNHNLTHWGKHEEFPSLGLPHAIWYGKSTSKKYQEQFPELVRYLRKNLKLNPQQIAWPALLQTEPLPAAPWESQEEFAKLKKISLAIENVKESLELTAIQNTQKAQYKAAYALFELRHFLSNPQILQLQAQFVLEKTFLSLHRILAASHRESPEGAQLLYRKIQLLLNSPEGVLAIVDYLNFKGEGLKPSERTPLGKHPWGLKTVLETMATSDLANAPLHFAQAALCSLQRLAYHSGSADSATQLQRYAWLNGGWKTRVESNYIPNTFSTVRCNKSVTQSESR